MGIASSIGGFFVEIGAKIDNGSFDKGEKKVANLGASIKGLVGEITAMSTALVGMATAAGTVETKNLKLAQSIGISAEKLDQWKMSASIAGTNADALVSSMDSIEQKMRGLKTGNVDMNLAKNLGFLDIGYSEFADMNADERMKAVIESARSMQDQEMASKLVADVLGEAGKDYYSYLQLSGKSLNEQLKQSKRLVFTDENSKREAMGFNAEIKGLFETMKSLGTFIASKIAGQLTPIVHKIKDIIAQNKELIKSGITGFITSVGTAFNNIINIFSRVAPLIGRLVNHFGGLDKIIVKVGVGIAGLKLAKLAGGVISVVQSVGLLKTALMGLGLGLLFELIDDITVYLSGSGRSMIGFIINNLDTIKEKIEGFMPNVNFGSVIQSFKDLGKEFGNLLMKFTGRNTIAEAIDKIVTTAGKLLGNTFTGAMNVLTNLVNLLTALLQGDWELIGIKLQKFFFDLGEDITNLLHFNDSHDDDGRRVMGGDGSMLDQLLDNLGHPIDNTRVQWFMSDLKDAVNQKAGREVWTGNFVTGLKASSTSGWFNARLKWNDLSWEMKQKIAGFVNNDGISPQTFKNFIDVSTMPMSETSESRVRNRIDDGIIAPNGRVTQVAPDDWVIAAKDLGNVASAFMPRNYGNVTSSMSSPVTINQNFTFNGNAREFTPAIKQQAYAGTKDALSQNFRNSQRILQQMSGTR